MKRLVISPHMDDESMGCGGLLAKYGPECLVLNVAGSGQVREREHAAAMEILGVTNVHNLDYPDGYVHDHMAQLVADVDAVMAEHHPEEVYLPYPSLHQDHIAAYEAGMRSCRMSMSHLHWYPPMVYVYDVAVYDLSLYPTDLRWNVFEELTAAQAEAKERACQCYVSETPEGPHPLTSIKQIAAAVGRTHQMDYAEQYALVREIRR